MKVFAVLLFFLSLGSYGQNSNKETSNKQCPYINEGGRHEYMDLIQRLAMRTDYKGNKQQKKGQGQGSGSE